MGSPSASHHVVCLGVPGDVPLAFPETNARDVFQLFTGALGPPRAHATCLVGAHATKRAVAGIFAAAERAPAPFFMMYFSGRASEKGLHVADGCVGPKALARHLTRVSSPKVLLVLDIVAGQARDPSVVPRWVEAVTAARAGMRVAAARATRIGIGAPGAGKARFTAAMLEALDRADGDLDFLGARYISDARAVETSAAILEKRWAPTQLPVRVGAFGDFPLARCQAKAVVGSGAVLGLACGARVAGTVRFSLEGRMGVPTVLRYSLEDAERVTLGSGNVTVVADSQRFTGKERIRLPSNLLAEHPAWAEAIAEGGRMHVRWRISLEDTRGRLLDRKVYGHEYGALPKPWRGRD